jgi:hypothetical protein
MAGVEDDLPAIVHTDPRSPGDLTPVVVDCEHALLGALLRSETVQDAVGVLAAVADEDFADPWVRQAVALCRRVAGDGVVPVASVLLARLSLERGLHQHRLMRVLLVDAWWAGPPPITAWPLVVAVLESSYRRAARCWADRVRQASDGPLDVLAEVVRDYAPVRTVWRRLTTAHRTTQRMTASRSTSPMVRAWRRDGSTTSVREAPAA